MPFERDAFEGEPPVMGLGTGVDQRRGEEGPQSGQEGWQIRDSGVRDLGRINIARDVAIEGREFTRYGSDWSYMRLSDGASLICKGSLPSHTAFWILLRVACDPIFVSCSMRSNFKFVCLLREVSMLRNFHHTWSWIPRFDPWIMRAVCDLV